MFIFAVIYMIFLVLNSGITRYLSFLLLELPYIQHP